MSTGLKVYIKDIYFPHIEYEIDRRTNVRIVIQHLVHTYQKQKVILWFKFYVTMKTKHRVFNEFTLNVI